MRVGVDTGGTFTDCIVTEGSGLKVLKVFSTPDSSKPSSTAFDNCVSCCLNLSS
jgi:N-methylhydantoinase A/oxoprolinase/acetone carboxylase beta subunit